MNPRTIALVGLALTLALGCCGCPGCITVGYLATRNDPAVQPYYPDLPLPDDPFEPSPKPRRPKPCPGPGPCPYPDPYSPDPFRPEPSPDPYRP